MIHNRITAREAAQLLGITVKAVCASCRAGAYRAEKTKLGWIIDRDSLPLAVPAETEAPVVARTPNEAARALGVAVSPAPADPEPETAPAEPAPADPELEPAPADPEPETAPADPEPETAPAEPVSVEPLQVVPNQIDAKTAARLRGVDLSTVYNWCVSGRCEAVKIGSTWYIDAETLPVKGERRRRG